MENIKKKINNLKNELDIKQDLIDDLNEKLKLEQELRKEAENQNATLVRKLQLVEGDLDNAEEKLAYAKAQLVAVEQQSEDGNRAYRSLENEFNTSINKYETHLDDLKNSKSVAEEMTRKYEEVARRLVLMDSELEKAEERLETSQAKNAELQENSKELTSLLKSYEAMESSFGIKESQSDDQIHSLKRHLQESETAREAAEKSLERLMKQVEGLEDENAYLRAESCKATQLYSEALRELNDM